MKKPYVPPQLVPLNHPLQKLVTAACAVADENCCHPDPDTPYGQLILAVEKLRSMDQSEPPGRFFVLVGSR